MFLGEWARDFRTSCAGYSTLSSHSGIHRTGHPNYPHNPLPLPTYYATTEDHRKQTSNNLQNDPRTSHPSSPRSLLSISLLFPSSVPKDTRHSSSYRPFYPSFVSHRPSTPHHNHKKQLSHSNRQNIQRHNHPALLLRLSPPLLPSLHPSNSPHQCKQRSTVSVRPENSQLETLIAPDHAPEISINVTTGGVLQICTQKLAKDTRLLTNDLSLHQRDPEYPLLHHGITAGANRRTTLALLERFRYVTNYTITVFYFSY
jgi:hypothetical protein